MWLERYNYLDIKHWFFWPVLLGLVLFTGGIMMIRQIKKEQQPKGDIIAIYVWAGFIMLWTIGVGCDFISERLSYRSIILHKEYKETEGEVEHFNTYHNNKFNVYYDTFTVNQVHFQVRSRNFRAMPLRVDTTSKAVANGRWVKIQYIGSVVLKLWVKDSGQ